ncbi:reverse transcriptase-like protein [Microbacterium sp. gxy059]|uniref:reverse transcriptase-like protein n=1 Tax=Microbacterium sp. gxy059 TaxID=2957199 RepID=UPI003D984B4E
MSARRLIVEADGGSRGNPGTAAGGAIVVDPDSGEVIVELGVYVGVATNNVAEYNGMLAGIEAALGYGADALHVRMDSKLVVEQMSGRWKIKHPDMKKLADRAREVIGSVPTTFEWIPRAENAAADRLANESMDQRQSFRRDLGEPSPGAPEARDPSADTLF